MNESEAWAHIASEIERRGLLGLGLCREISELAYFGAISATVADKMEARIYDFLDEQAVILESANMRYHEVILWPYGEPGPRIIAATLFSLLAADGQ